MNQIEANFGDKVCYQGVQGYLGDTGTITSLGPTKRGGDCLVRWNHNQNIQSEERLSNLEHKDPKSTPASK